jgi:hypothetical protein
MALRVILSLREIDQTLQTTHIKKRAHPPASGSPIERRSIGEYDRRMSKFENLQYIAFFSSLSFPSAKV